MRRILGLHGASGSGKDTVANHLCQHGWERIAFSAALRRALYELDPWIPLGEGCRRIRELVDEVGWDEAKGHAEVRRLHTSLGTDVARKQWDEDFWVGRLRDGLQGLGGRVVVTDVRYPNEAALLRQASSLMLRFGDRTTWSWVPTSGRILKVHRPGAGLQGSAALHCSETSEVPVDATLHNDGTIEELCAKVDAVVAAWWP